MIFPVFFFIDKSRNLFKFVLVLLSASVEIVGVSRMRDFYIQQLFLLISLVVRSIPDNCQQYVPAHNTTCLDQKLIFFQSSLLESFVTEVFLFPVGLMALDGSRSCRQEVWKSGKCRGECTIVLHCSFMVCKKRGRKNSAANKKDLIFVSSHPLKDPKT